MEHSAECVDAQSKWEERAAEYDAKWPGHCQTCHGAGGSCYSYDPSPPGVALSRGSMTDCDPCPACMDQGICPRCGQSFNEDEWAMEDVAVPCPRCGWGWDIKPGDSRPEQPECPCLYEELAQATGW